MHDKKLLEKYSTNEFIPKQMNFELWSSFHIGKGNLLHVECKTEYNDKPTIEVSFCRIENNSLISIGNDVSWKLDSYRGKWANTIWTSYEVLK